MFRLFAKKIHEPEQQQRADVEQYPTLVARLILSGESCDQVKGSHEAFGSLTNPIPVNGALGEIKYLAKLRGVTGQALFFHRLGSVTSPVTHGSVDLYEVVCLDGTQWGRLYFDMYHPRRSIHAPDGYSLVPFNKALGMDLPLGFGVNATVPDFPYGLPELLVRAYGNEALGRHAQDWLGRYEFARPTLPEADH